MLTEDFIRRMISQAAAVLAQVLLRRKAGQYLEAHSAIDEMLSSVFGMRADLLKRMDDESLLTTLIRGEQMDTDRLRVAADLYRAEADVFADSGRPVDARLSYLRALRLYLEFVLHGGSENFSEPVQEVEEILARLQDVDMPKETWMLLHQYYTFTDQPEKAEAALANWL